MREPAYLQTARSMGDYLVRESLTPSCGKYPAFTRSTGKRDQFPLAEDCGSQADRPHEIEPDKGGIAGYALALLADATNDAKYLAQALQNARVLAVNQQDGDATRITLAVSGRLSQRRGPRACLRQHDLYPAPL